MASKQQEYNKQWIENSEKQAYKRYHSYHSTTKTFINKYSRKNHLIELKELIEKKLNEFE